MGFLEKQPETIVDYLKGIIIQSDSCPFANTSIIFHIFNCLNPLEKTILIRLVLNPRDLSFNPSHTKQLNSLLQNLSNLKLIILDPIKTPSLNINAKKAIFDAIFNPNFSISQAKTYSVSPQKVKILQKSASLKWITIFYCLIGEDVAKNGNQISIKMVNEFLEFAKYSLGQGVKGGLSAEGFKLLLKGEEGKTWGIVYHLLNYFGGQYIGLNLTDYCLNGVLFILEICALPENRGFLREGLSASKRIVAENLCEFGLCIKATRANCDLGSEENIVYLASKKLNSLASEDNAERKFNENGFIIVETNFKVFAYTNDPLKIYALNTFSKIDTKLNDFVAGTITRTSILGALRNGLSSTQIISYLHRNAHPLLKNGRDGVSLTENSNLTLPRNVVDQIKLWESQLDRYRIIAVTLYDNFASMGEIKAVEETLSRRKNCKVWREKNKKWIIAENK